jgi:hypothetical protein
MASLQVEVELSLELSSMNRYKQNSKTEKKKALSNFWHLFSFYISSYSLQLLARAAMRRDPLTSY